MALIQQHYCVFLTLSLKLKTENKKIFTRWHKQRLLDGNRLSGFVLAIYI